MNQERGETEIRAGEVTYKLVLDTNALCELEAMLSTPDRPLAFPDIIAGCTRGRFLYIRAVIWAALRRHHKDVTVEGAGRIMDMAGGPDGLLSQIKTMAESTKPDAEDAKVIEGPRPLEAQAAGGRRRRGAGQASTGSPDKSA